MGVSCNKAQFVIPVYRADDSDLTVEERVALVSHLQTCRECFTEYEQSKFIIDIARDHWQISEDTLALIEKAAQPAECELTIEEAWRDWLRRCPDFAEPGKHRTRRQFFRRVGAVAACLIVSVSIFPAFSSPERLKSAQESVPEQVLLAPRSSIKVELVSESGNTLIPAGREITSGEESKTLVINDKHRTVLNFGTTASLEPLIQSDQVGCLVKLDSDQVCGHFGRHFNPFVVTTTHGQAVTTGTTFDIAATCASTTLVVVAGSVKREWKNAAVNVAEGQTSEMVGQSTPSSPVSCDVAEPTAWATGYKPGPALAQVESDTGPWYLSLPLGKEPIVLEETDYDRLAEWERNCFKQEFPWIFQLKGALAEEGIGVDYPELLIKTGDAWQLVCLSVSPARFSIVDPNFLLKTASSYGLDKQWLLENVPAAKSILQKCTPLRETSPGLMAFAQWLNYATAEDEVPLPLCSSDASGYLKETRSLIWFA